MPRFSIHGDSVAELRLALDELEGLVPPSAQGAAPTASTGRGRGRKAAQAPDPAQIPTNALPPAGPQTFQAPAPSPQFQAPPQFAQQPQPGFQAPPQFAQQPQPSFPAPQQFSHTPLQHFDVSSPSAAAPGAEDALGIDPNVEKIIGRFNSMIQQGGDPIKQQLTKWLSDMLGAQQGYSYEQLVEFVKHAQPDVIARMLQATVG